jgi:hypothetical protein
VALSGEEQAQARNAQARRQARDAQSLERAAQSRTQARKAQARERARVRDARKISSLRETRGLLDQVTKLKTEQKLADGMTRYLLKRKREENVNENQRRKTRNVKNDDEEKEEEADREFQKQQVQRGERNNREQERHERKRRLQDLPYPSRRSSNPKKLRLLSRELKEDGLFSFTRSPGIQRYDNNIRGKVKKKKEKEEEEEEDKEEEEKKEKVKAKSGFFSNIAGWFRGEKNQKSAEQAVAPRQAVAAEAPTRITQPPFSREPRTSLSKRKTLEGELQKLTNEHSKEKDDDKKQKLNLILLEVRKELRKEDDSHAKDFVLEMEDMKRENADGIQQAVAQSRDESRANSEATIAYKKQKEEKIKRQMKEVAEAEAESAEAAAEAEAEAEAEGLTWIKKSAGNDELT